MESVGYFVIQWPIKSRDKMRTKKALSEAGTKITRLMKRLGYDRGYRAWHYFGDPKCPNGCQDKSHKKSEKLVNVDALNYQCPVCDSVFPVSKAKVKWNPHMNLMIDGRYIDENEMESIKKRMKVTLKETGLIIHYEYAKPEEISKKVHLVKYITRATFLSYEWDKKMIKELHKFRGLSSWGSRDAWNGPDVWELEEGKVETSNLIKLEDNKCTDCGECLNWSPVIHPVLKLRFEWAVEELEGGYLRLEMLDRHDTLPKISKFVDVEEGKLSDIEVAEWYFDIEDKLYSPRVNKHNKKDD